MRITNDDLALLLMCADRMAWHMRAMELDKSEAYGVRLEAGLLAALGEVRGRAVLQRFGQLVSSELGGSPPRRTN